MHSLIYMGQRDQREPAVAPSSLLSLQVLMLYVSVFLIYGHAINKCTIAVTMLNPHPTEPSRNFSVPLFEVALPFSLRMNGIGKKLSRWPELSGATPKATIITTSTSYLYYTPLQPVLRNRIQSVWGEQRTRKKEALDLLFASF